MVELYYVEDDQNIAGIVKEYFREKKINVTIFSRIDAVREALKVKDAGNGSTGLEYAGWKGR